jgi:hypothetical protein
LPPCPRPRPTNSRRISPACSAGATLGPVGWVGTPEASNESPISARSASDGAIATVLSPPSVKKLPSLATLSSCAGSLSKIWVSRSSSSQPNASLSPASNRMFWHHGRWVGSRDLIYFFDLFDFLEIHGLRLFGWCRQEKLASSRPTDPCVTRIAQPNA